MARLPHPLASGALTPTHAPVGSVWHHIFLDRFPDPRGFGFASSRFSDPRRRKAKRFGVHCVGQTFEVAFLETIVRDLRNGNPGPLVLCAIDLDDYVHVHITVQARLDLVDLRGATPSLSACRPTPCASPHRLGQQASLAVYQRADRLEASVTRPGSTATRIWPSTTESCRSSPPDLAVNSEVAQSFPRSLHLTELR